MHRHFATICSRITWFSPKCSEKIIVYRSMQNVYKLIKYSLINSRNGYIYERHVNTTPLTVEDRSPIKTLQTGKGWIVKKT